MSGSCPSGGGAIPGGCFDSNPSPAPAPPAGTPPTILTLPILSGIVADHVGKVGYGPKMKDKQADPDAPSDVKVKAKKVTSHKMEHVTFTYHGADGADYTTHAQIFARYVSHPDHPAHDGGLFKGHPGVLSLGYEINDPGGTPDKHFDVADVTHLEDYCVGLDIPTLGTVEVILFEVSKKVKH